MEGIAPVPCDKCTKAVFCSTKCHATSMSSSHRFLCTEDKVQELKETSNLINYSITNNTRIPILALKFCGKVVEAVEKAATQTDSYGILEHLDRLQAADIKPKGAESNELNLITEVFSHRFGPLPGFDECM